MNHLIAAHAEKHPELATEAAIIESYYRELADQVIVAFRADDATKETMITHQRAILSLQQEAPALFEECKAAALELVARVK